MKRVQLIIAVAALGLFAWVIAHAGLSVMAAQLRAMRIALPIVLVLSAVRLFLQSTTWSASLRGESVDVNRGRLAGVRLASQSMGYLTVFGPVLSEPMKIKLLGTSPGPTVTATFLDTGVYWFTSLLVALLGIVCLPMVAVHGRAHQWIPILLTLALGVFVITRRGPLLAGVVRALGGRTPSWLARAKAWEEAIRNYRLQQPALVGRMFWIGVACQLLIASEVSVVLWSLHLPIHFFSVLAIEGVTRALRMASGWIPARVGADEGGAVSAFGAVGLSPMLGLGLALTRRVRDLLWAMFGIAWLVCSSRKTTPRHAIKPSLSTNLSERGV